MRLKPAFISLSLAAAMAAALMFAVTGCEDDHDLRGDEMYISPSSYTFRRSSDVVATFSVHGAKLPVQWSVADPVLGNVTGVEADKDVTVTTANYQREPGQYGANTVIVRDARGWQASARVSVREGLDDVDVGGE
ncbi:MAG: hypothetical protein GX174_02865 [Lentisphaerae bacterium]|jgi:hypothetical protein|nr:hypothetical protein [Lentisphaerota bacterium]